ncbi:hypothetical protein Dimus_003806 [Dionaea muscipula]
MEEDLTASFHGQKPYGDCPSPSINTPELDCFLGSDSIPSDQFTNELVLIDPLKDSWLHDCLNVGPDVSDPDNREGITWLSHREAGRGGPRDGGFGCRRPLCTWPPTPVPFHRTCCQVLREIVHTNGIHTMKFEIHGRIGLISHGILENYYNGSENRDRQMFDVKNFLKNYLEERRLATYTLLPDALSMFYKTLCVGLDNQLPTSSFHDLVSSHTSDGDTLVNSGKQDQAETINLAERQINGNSQQEAAHHLEAIQPAADPSPLAGQHHGRYSTVASPAVTAGNQGQTSSTAIGDVVNSTEEAGNRGGTSKALVIMKNQPEISSDTRLTNPVRRQRSYAEQVNKLRKEMSLWKKRLNSADGHDKEIARTEIQRLQQEIEDIYSGKVVI